MKPTQAQFADAFDSFIHKTDDLIQIRATSLDFAFHPDSALAQIDCLTQPGEHSVCITHSHEDSYGTTVTATTWGKLFISSAEVPSGKYAIQRLIFMPDIAYMALRRDSELTQLLRLYDYRTQQWSAWQSTDDFSNRFLIVTVPDTFDDITIQGIGEQITITDIKGSIMGWDCSSDDTGIATIEKTSDTTAIVTAIAEGQTTIQFGDGGFSAPIQKHITVTVEP